MYCGYILVLFYFARQIHTSPKIIILVSLAENIPNFAINWPEHISGILWYEEVRYTSDCGKTTLFKVKKLGKLFRKLRKEICM